MKAKFRATLVSLFLSSALAVSTVPVYAAGLDTGAVKSPTASLRQTAIVPIGIDQLSPKPPDLSNYSIDSLNVPSRYYDLNKGQYYADLQLVGPSWLYTNCYFHASSSGVINVGYRFETRTHEPARLVIGLYDMNQRKIVLTWTSNSLRDDNSSMHFYGLSRSTNYAVAFLCASGTSFRTTQLSGNASIFH